MRVNDQSVIHPHTLFSRLCTKYIIIPFSNLKLTYILVFWKSLAHLYYNNLVFLSQVLFFNFLTNQIIWQH